MCRMANAPEPQAPEVHGPISSDSLPWKIFDKGRFSGRVRHLTKPFGDYRVGVLIEELPPGKQSCPFHYHIHEEEHVLMLEGTVTLRLGERRYQLQAGDYVCFPAGQRAGHCLINEGEQPCRYLVIGENTPNEVCVYPDSNKISVRALREIYDKGAVRDYYDGEGS